MTFRAAILLDIDGTAVAAVAVTAHTSVSAARTWIEQRLPLAQVPDWVARRPCDVAGVCLVGQVERGAYPVQGHQGVNWEPDPDAPVWDADLIDGVVRWRPHTHTDR